MKNIIKDTVLNIIYAEDEESTLKSIKNMIEKIDYINIDCVSNGHDLIEKCREKDYDLIISDIKMPRLNGLDAIEQIKKFQPNVKTIIISGYGEKNILLKSIHLGIDKFIEKPFDMANLMNFIIQFYESKISLLKKKERNDLLYKAIEFSKIGTLYYNSKSNNIHVDDVFCLLYSKKLKTLEEFLDFIEDDYIDKVSQLFNTLENKFFVEIIKLKKLDIYVKFSGVVEFDKMTNFYNMVALSEDVSELVNSKIELQTQKTQIEMAYFATKIKNKQLKKAQAELKKQQEIVLDKSRTKTINEIIRVLTHEWRQPLNLISLKAQYLLIQNQTDILDNNTMEDELNSIKDTTEDLSNTLNDFTKYIDDEFSVKVDVDLENLIKDCRDVLKAQMTSLNIDFTVNFHDENKLTLNILPFDLKNVLISVVLNSIEAIHANKVKEPFIKIDVSIEEDIVNINILDNGGGINNRIIDKVFDPYFSTKYEKSGKGLGLYFVKQILINKLKGDIKLKNTDNGLLSMIKFKKGD